MYLKTVGIYMSRFAEETFDEVTKKKSYISDQRHDQATIVPSPPSAATRRLETCTCKEDARHAARAWK